MKIRLLFNRVVDGKPRAKGDVIEPASPARAKRLIRQGLAEALEPTAEQAKPAKEK